MERILLQIMAEVGHGLRFEQQTQLSRVGLRMKLMIPGLRMGISLKYFGEVQSTLDVERLPNQEVMAACVMHKYADTHAQVSQENVVS